ncbi:H(+)/Cl(-) exchange transporter 7-like [Macrosteles quadrilineatus]|uniref:H(+)/Cl(-) exchange transporter 7-like n=1 Tax=Macrosteles quadrilineatus TaxID=74068 RepID=UPI0023E1B0B7|nr:H(+)/Cl(-) exchange transporter 7-like [Macrosteles quadrilineatus]
MLSKSDIENNADSAKRISSSLSMGEVSYYTKDTQPENIKSNSREEVTYRKAAKTASSSKFFVSDTFDSLDYTPITNQLELARQKMQTFGSLMVEDSLRLFLFVVAGIVTAVICVFMEFCIHSIGHWKYGWFNTYIMDSFETHPYELVSITLARFVSVLVPVMLGTALVVFIAPYAAGGGVAHCIAYLNGIRVPKILSMRGLFVKLFSTICTCVSGLAGGKEGPAMHIGAIIGGSLPSCLPWLQFRSDQERRDLAAAGFGAGIAVVFGAPIGGMLLALEEGVSFWDIGLMWKMYLCCIVCYAVGSVVYSIILGVDVRLNNPELSTLGAISTTITRYELFEIIPFSIVAIIGGLLGALLIKIHIYVYTWRHKFITDNKRKLLLSFVASIILTLVQDVSIRCLRHCSPMSDEEMGRLTNDTDTKRAHQLYCGDGEHSDMSLMFQQTQADILRSFFGKEILDTNSLIWFSFVYFFLLCMTWGLSISYGVFVPQIIFGAAWGRLFGTFLQHSFPDTQWPHPAKYSYIGAAAQLSATVGKTFSVLMIMVEASGSINFSFPLMVVVIITKVVGTFFVVPIYQTQMLLQGLPFLYTKPPPLSLDITSSNIMSQSVTKLIQPPTVQEILDVLKMTNHNGYPVVDQRSNLLGLILRQQLLVLLMYKAYKFPPPKTMREMCECLRVYLKHARKRLNDGEILDSVQPKYYNTKVDLTPYYDAFPSTVTDNTPAVKAYCVFRNMALRHLIVIHDNVPVGVITRKDLAKFHTFENFFRLGVTEMLVKS